jgi:flavodoxin
LHIILIQEIAEQIKELVGGTIFRIEPVEKYPRKYQEILKVSKVEINNNIRLQLTNTVKNIDQYESIFVGSPNWYSTIAPTVATFLSEYDLSGKNVIPFLTHGGVVHCITDIKKLSVNATILERFVIAESLIGKVKQELQDWLTRIQILG